MDNQTSIPTAPAGAAAADGPNLTGRTLGDFHILREIGERAKASPQCPPELAEFFAGLDIEPHYRRSVRAEWRRSMVHRFAPSSAKVLISRLIKRGRRRAHRKAVL